VIALARHLLARSAESLDLMLNYSERLLWASAVCDLEGSRVVWAIAKYQASYHRLPIDMATLQEYVNKTTDEAIQRRRNIVIEEMVEVGAETDAIPGDLELLIQHAIEAGRVTYFKTTATIAVGLATDTIDRKVYREKVNKFGTGPDAGANYMRDAITKDKGVTVVREIEGPVHENLELVSMGLDDALLKPDEGRLKTGIPIIDESVLIGEKHAKYIGLVAPTGGGKSTLARSMLYQFAAQGANVLYVPLEQGTQETMAQFVWLHADAIGLGEELPSLFDWHCNPHTVTQRQVDIKNEVFADYKQRRSIPGIVDVVHKSSMSDVLGHYESYKNRMNYNVVCIDYVSKLAVPGKTADDKEEHRRDFDLFHDLCRRDNIVCITPMQCNRNGLVAAETVDELTGFYGTFPSVNSIEQYSNAAQGMDLVLGVFFRGLLKDQNKMRISSLKIRGSGKDIPATDLHVDPSTRRVRDLNIGNHASVRRPGKRPDSKDCI
jgi:KaiC/GvpD/RAD55 family RecA-like ATPase